MLIKSQKDFFAGLFFTGIGLAFAIGAVSYGMGDAAKMGPGYFPRLIGLLMTALGAFIIFESLTIKTEDGEKIGKWAWKPLFFILAANLVFGALLSGLPSIGFPAFGLIVAIYALTFIASLGGDEFNFKSVFVLATILAIISYAAFILLLKLQFLVWPAFLTK